MDLLRKLGASFLLASSSFFGACAQDRYNNGEITREEFYQQKKNEDALGLTLMGGLIGGLAAQKGDAGGVVLGEAVSRHGAALAAQNQTRQEVTINANSVREYAAPERVFLEPAERAIDLGSQDFGSFISGSRRAVLFYAPWCPASKKTLPEFERVALETPGVRFGELNVDEYKEIASRFSINALPTIVYFDKGNKKAAQSGGATFVMIRDKATSVYFLNSP